MKFVDIIKTATPNLLRSKTRTILTMIAIFIGAFTIAMTIGMNIGVNDFVTQQVGSIGGEQTLFVQPDVGTTEEGPQKYEAKTADTNGGTILTLKDLEKIKAVKGVDAITAIPLSSADYISGANHQKYVLSTMVDMGAKNQIATGRSVNQDAKEAEITLEKDLVKALGYKSEKAALNQTVEIGVTSPATGEQKTFKAKIVGIKKFTLVQGGLSTVNQAFDQATTNFHEAGLPDSMKNQYYGFFTNSKPDTSKADMIKIKKAVTKLGYHAETLEDQITTIRQVVNAITGTLILFGSIALIAASFGIINTLFMSVQERTREIGLMKAMGLSRGKVFLLFSIEAILIGFFGSLFGILAAIPAGHLINDMGTKSFLKGLEGLKLIDFNPLAILSIMCLIMFIAFLAGTLPARRAAKLDAITALRYE